jgi:glutamate--cysteine ligase
MSAPPSTSGEPVEDRRQLVAWIEKGFKPADRWLIGTEHEKFPFRLSDRSPVPYAGDRGIGALLEGLTRFGWEPVREDGNVIALAGRDGANVSLEPGGQLELSGAPLASVHETEAEISTHLAQVREVAGGLGVGMLGLGFAPTWRRDEVPWMPKGRYGIMRDYMPKRGSLGLDMMLRTCTVQVNLDFSSEADLVKKFRVSLALQPLATALFANSPFTEGRPNGHLSHRGHVWTDTDPDRTGDLPFVFEDGFGIERYVDWVLDAPMYFVFRDGRYVDASGQSFRAFMEGRLPARPGEVPLITDWSDHLTTVFPDVRLKRYLEMRGADSGSERRLSALPALWTGLLYDGTALDAAWDLVKGWTAEDRAILRREVPRLGLDAPLRGGSLRPAAVEALRIARAGLAARARLDSAGRDETRHLDALDETASSGVTPAHEMLAKFAGRWGGRIEPVFEEYAY